MKKYVLASTIAMLSILCYTISSFAQQGFHGPYEAQDIGIGGQGVIIIEYEGQTFELVSMKLEDLNLTGNDHIEDLLKTAGYLGLRPFNKETADKINLDRLIFSSNRKVHVVSQPFTLDSITTGVLYMSYIRNNKKELSPVGDVHRGAYANIKWFYKDGDSFLFLRAVRDEPKP